MGHFISPCIIFKYGLKLQDSEINFEVALGSDTPHRWALTPISMISDIGLSLISELLISDWRERSPTLFWYRNKLLSYILYPTSSVSSISTVAERLRRSPVKTRVWGANTVDATNFFRISEWTQMSISELFWYRNDSFQSNIFSSDIGITDVDVGCRISPTLDRCWCPPMPPPPGTKIFKLEDSFSMDQFGLGWYILLIYWNISIWFSS